MKKLARSLAVQLLEAGERKKTWTTDERRHWTAAFNALQRLAGKKTVIRGGKLVTDAA